MNAHTIQISERDYQTTLHSCGCPDFTRRGGGYMFYNFLTGDTLVGCKHMHAMYISQAKKFTTDLKSYKAHSEDLEMRLKRVIAQRIEAEDQVHELEWKNKNLQRKIDELTGKAKVTVEDPFACFE